VAFILIIPPDSYILSINYNVWVVCGKQEELCIVSPDMVLIYPPVSKV
jgi:hypothetical protein